MAVETSDPPRKIQLGPVGSVPKIGKPRRMDRRGCARNGRILAVVFHSAISFLTAAKCENVRHSSSSNYPAEQRITNKKRK